MNKTETVDGVEVQYEGTQKPNLIQMVSIRAKSVPYREQRRIMKEAGLSMRLRDDLQHEIKKAKAFMAEGYAGVSVRVFWGFYL